MMETGFMPVPDHVHRPPKGFGVGLCTLGLGLETPRRRAVLVLAGRGAEDRSVVFVWWSTRKICKLLFEIKIT